MNHFQYNHLLCWPHVDEFVVSVMIEREIFRKRYGSDGSIAGDSAAFVRATRDIGPIVTLKALLRGESEVTVSETDLGHLQS